MATRGIVLWTGVPVLALAIFFTGLLCKEAIKPNVVIINDAGSGWVVKEWWTNNSILHDQCLGAAVWYNLGESVECTAAEIAAPPLDGWLVGRNGVFSKNSEVLFGQELLVVGLLSNGEVLVHEVSSLDAARSHSELNNYIRSRVVPEFSPRMFLEFEGLLERAVRSY